MSVDNLEKNQFAIKIDREMTFAFDEVSLTDDSGNAKIKLVLSASIKYDQRHSGSNTSEAITCKECAVFSFGKAIVTGIGSLTLQITHQDDKIYLMPTTDRIEFIGIKGDHPSAKNKGKREA